MFKVIAHTPRGKFEAKFRDKSKENVYNLTRDGDLDFLSFRGINNSDSFVLRSEVFSKTVFEFVDIEEDNESSN